MLKVSVFAFVLCAAAMPAQAEPFSKLDQKMYLKECIDGDAAMTAYCECTLTEMQKRMTLAEYHALGELPEDKIMDNEKFADSIVACSDTVQ